jgi:hypothetical protein
MAIFKDDFGRASANLEDSPTSSSGGTWTHDGNITGALTIDADTLGGILHCNTTNSTGSAYWALDHETKNHYVQFDVVSIGNTTGAFWACRLGDRSNFIGVRAGNDTGNGQIDVFTRIAGTFANLYISPNNTVVVGDTVRMEVQDTAYTVYLNGVQLTTGAIGDSGALDDNTKAGVVARSINAGIGDNFESGRVGQIDISLTVAGVDCVTGLSMVDASGATGISIDATGSDATGSVGDVSVALPISVSATGVSGTGSVGDETVTAKKDVLVIAGQAPLATASEGDISITSDNALTVTGLGMVSHVGSVGLGHWFPIDLSGTETWTRINP